MKERTQGRVRKPVRARVECFVSLQVRARVDSLLAFPLRKEACLRGGGFAASVPFCCLCEMVSRPASVFWKRRLQFDLLTEVACKGRGRIGFCSSKREKDKRPVRCYSHFLDEMAGPKLIACVGDVHGFWNKESEDALCWLRPDLSLFVGDFGEEDVELVRQIADVRDRKAVILGNHDGKCFLFPNFPQSIISWCPSYTKRKANEGDDVHSSTYPLTQPIDRSEGMN